MSSNNHLVLKRLYEDIVVGAFSFGTKLGEEQLVARYGVKRHVLREAFGQLEELGLVEHVPNRGVFVREPSPSEVRELFEIRELLAKSMTLPVSPEIIDALREVQVRHSAAARAAQYREVLHLNTEFHRIQYAACGNETLTSAIEGYAVRTHLISAMKFGDASTMEIVIGQHEEIIDAMSGEDRDRLALAIRSHFDLARIDQYEQQYRIRHGEDSQSANANRPRHRIGVAAVS